MAHNEHSLGFVNVAQVVLKPLYGVEVKVIGGLVKQQIVGLAEESLGQHDAHFLVVRQFCHLFFVQLLVYA